MASVTGKRYFDPRAIVADQIMRSSSKGGLPLVPSSSASIQRVPSKQLEQLQKNMESVYQAWQNPDYLPTVMPKHVIASHVLGSYFVDGMAMDGENLTGSSLFTMSLYMINSLDTAAKSQGVTDEVSGYRNALLQIYEVGQVQEEIKALVGNPGDFFADKQEHWHNCARLFSEWMFFRLSALKNQETFTIPGGFIGNIGHSMVYEVRKKSISEFEVRVFNTGGGLEYHPRVKEWCKDEGMQILTLTANSDLFLSGTLWQAYYEMQFTHYPVEHSEPYKFTEKDVYAWLSTFDPQIKSKGMQSASKPDALFRREQATGICTFEAILLLAKDHLSKTSKGNLYHRLRSTIRETALRNYVGHLEKRSLLPQLGDSPAFKDKAAIYRQLGALQLLNEEVDKLRRETLRNIRKNHEALVAVGARTHFLRELQGRIDARIEGCHTALRDRAFTAETFDTTFSINSVPKSSVRSILKPSSAPPAAWKPVLIPLWPKKQIDIVNFFKEIEATLGNLHDKEAFNLLNHCFATMPTVKSGYWEGMSAGDVKGCLESLAFFNKKYFDLTTKMRKGMQPDQHFFHMQKAMSVCLKLCERDPVMKDYRFPFDYSNILGFTNLSRKDIGCLFTTDPTADQEVAATLDFLRSKCHQGITPDPLRMVVKEDAHYNSTDLTSVWKAMDASLKKKITADIVITHRIPHHNVIAEDVVLPSALILAYALANPKFAPSAGYKAVYQQMLIMRCFWNFDVEKCESMPLLKVDGIEEWKKKGCPSQDFSLSLWDHVRKAPINKSVVSTFCPSVTESQTSSLMARTPSEHEMLREMDTLIRNEGEYVLFTRGMQCREDRRHQVYKALLFYSQNCHMLTQSVEQTRLMSLWLEPGVLIETLQQQKECFTDLCVFMTRSYQAFREDKDVLATLFILRLTTQVQAYAHAASIPDALFTKQVPGFAEELRRAWKEAETKPVEERAKEQYAIAREALAFYGRGGKVTPDDLTDFLRYHFYFREVKKPDKSDNPRLDAEAERGKIALTLHISEQSSLVLSPLFSTVVDLTAEDRAKLTWCVEKAGIGTFGGSSVVVTSSDGRYRIDLLKGEIYRDGQLCFLGIPDFLSQHVDFKRLFRDSEQIKHPVVRYFGNTMTVAFKYAGDDCFVRVKYYSSSESEQTRRFLRKFGSTNYWIYQPIKNNPKVNSVAPNTTAWFDEITGSFAFHNEKEEVVCRGVPPSVKTWINHEHFTLVRAQPETWAVCKSIGEKSQGFVKGLEAFDPKVQIWVQPNSNSAITHIDFPSYGLTLTASGGDLEAGGNLAGFRLSRQQHVKGLYQIVGGLVFENPVTSEKRVLLPRNKMDQNEQRTDFAEPLHYSQPIDTKPAFCTFVVKENEQLYSSVIADVLYLAMCYMHLGYYSEASDLLQTQAKKLTPFKSGEIALLQGILAEDPPLEHPKAKLIRLRACALFLENQELETSSVQERLTEKEGAVSGYMEGQMMQEFRRYREQCDMIASAEQLTEHEERLLFDGFKAYMSAQSKPGALPSKIPSTQLESVTEPETVVDFSKASFWGMHSYHLPTSPNRLFLDQTLPLGMTGADFEHNFLHLYDIARSRKADTESCQQREGLAVWLSCARRNTHAAEKVAFFAAILQMSDAELETLPDHQKIKKEPYNALSFVSDNYKVSLLPTEPATPPISRAPKVKHVPAPLPAPFKAMPPLVRLSQDVDIQSHLKTWFVRKTAGQSGDLRVRPLAAGNRDPFYVQSFEQMQQSIEEAMKSEHERAHYTLQPDALQDLIKTLQSEMSDFTQTKEAIEKNLLALAATFRPPPTDAFAGPKLALELQAKVQRPLTLKQLMFLFIRGDENAYKFANPYLTDLEIYKLYQDTAEWLLVKTRHQQLQRAFDLATRDMSDAPLGDYREAVVQKLYNEFAAVRGYEPTEERAMLAYEAERNLRLRPSQKAQIDMLKDPNKNSCHEIIMGSGKSDVIIPFLALQMANGKHLTLLVMQDELIEVEAAKLREYAQDMGQEEIRVNWRNSSLAGLKKLKYSLERIKAQRGFIATSVRELHDFYIYFLEHERRVLKDPDGLNNKARRDLFWEIRALLSSETIAYFDEVDSQLRCNFEVLKAIDEKQKLEKIYCQVMRALFDILAENKQITTNIYFKWSLSRKMSAQLYVPERDGLLLTNILSDEFLKLPQLTKWGVKFKAENRAGILAFLRTPVGAPFELPAGLDQTTMRALSHARKQIQTILPATLCNIYGQHYGIPPAKTGEKRRVLPVPYRGGGDPQLTSQFASTDEQMAYTLMSYYVEAPTLAPDLWEIVQKLKIQARMEMRVTLRPISETMAHKKYVQFFGKVLVGAYPLDKFEPKDVPAFAKTIASQPKLINQFVFHHAFPSVHEHRVRLTSNGQTVPMLFHRKKGLTGTLDQARNQFHRDFEIYPDREIVGKTLLYLSRPSKQGALARPLIFEPNENAFALLEDLLNLCMRDGNPMPHTIIDVAGVFKAVLPAINMAKLFLTAARRRNSRITSVVYYDGKRKKWMMLNHDSQQPVDYRPSKTEDKSTRVTYFDQKRCTGSNILQIPDAEALLPLNDKTDLQQFVQAAWRMRGLADKQRVMIACSTEVRRVINTYKYPQEPAKRDEEITLEDIFAFVKHIEVVRQIQDNLKSIYQQIDATFVFTVLHILGQHRNNYNRNVRLACEELSEHLVTKVNDDPTVQYGMPDRLEGTNRVLREYVQSRVVLIANWYQKHSTYITGAVTDLPFKADCDALIDHATKVGANYLPTQLSQKISSGGGSTVEVQQEQVKQEEQQEQNKNIARSSLLTEAQKEDSMHHIPWPDMTPKALEGSQYNAAVSTPLLPIWETYNSEATFQANMRDYRLSCIKKLRLQRQGAPQNPIISMTKALAFTGKLASKGAALKPEFADLFSENLLVSFNAIFTVEAQAPFFGAQKPLSEWMLLIQDKQDRSRTQLVLLSRKEAEDFMDMIHRDAGTELDRRRFAIALFSPRKRALRYQGGLYMKGPDAIDTTPLFSLPTSHQLTAFEELSLQAQFAMGETSLYTPRDDAYLSNWLNRTGAIKEKEDLFKNGFALGSLQLYENSRLSLLFAHLKKQATVPAPVPLLSQPTKPAGTPTTSPPAAPSKPFCFTAPPRPTPPPVQQPIYYDPFTTTPVPPPPATQTQPTTLLTPPKPTPAPIIPTQTTPAPLSTPVQPTLVQPTPAPRPTQILPPTPQPTPVQPTPAPRPTQILPLPIPIPVQQPVIVEPIPQIQEPVNPEQPPVVDVGYFQRLCNLLSAFCSAIFRFFCCLCIRFTNRSSGENGVENAEEIPLNVNGAEGASSLAREVPPPQTRTEDLDPGANQGRPPPNAGTGVNLGANQEEDDDDDDDDDDDGIEALASSFRSANSLSSTEERIEKLLSHWTQLSPSKEELRENLRKNPEFTAELEKNPHFTETLNKIAHSWGRV